jgi:enoyl-CoA hydratase/carnithine racemase
VSGGPGPGAYGTILLECSDGVAWVTLNRPERLNAMTEHMHHELLDVFARVADDPSVRVLVLTGAGERAFCIGSDLAFLGEVLDGEEPDVALFAAYLERLNSVVFALERLPVPTIAMVQAKARAIWCWSRRRPASATCTRRTGTCPVPGPRTGRYGRWDCSPRWNCC